MVHGVLLGQRPFPEEIKLRDQPVNSNIATLAEGKPANNVPDVYTQAQDDFMDRNFRASSALLAQWDGHEATNNWWCRQPASCGEHNQAKYEQQCVLRLDERTFRALQECAPITTNTSEPERVCWQLGFGSLVAVLLLDMQNSHKQNKKQFQYNCEQALFRITSANAPAQFYHAYDNCQSSGIESTNRLKNVTPYGYDPSAIPST